MTEEREIDDAALDDPEFYWKPWEDAEQPPWAAIARDVLYFHKLRSDLCQQALTQLGPRLA
jgi:hypothetical protein